MDLIQKLQESEVDVETAIKRFSGNEALYLRFIHKFPQDENYEKLMDALQSQNYSDVLIYAHTLKGLSANLGMNSLSDICNEMLKEIRVDSYDQLGQLLESLTAKYNLVLQAISDSTL